MSMVWRVNGGEKLLLKAVYVLEKMRKFGAQDKVCRETFAFL